MKRYFDMRIVTKHFRYIVVFSMLNFIKIHAETNGGYPLPLLSSAGLEFQLEPKVPSWEMVWYNLGRMECNELEQYGKKVLLSDRGSGKNGKADSDLICTSAQILRNTIMDRMIKGYVKETERKLDIVVKDPMPYSREVSMIRSNYSRSLDKEYLYKKDFFNKNMQFRITSIEHFFVKEVLESSIAYSVISYYHIFGRLNFEKLPRKISVNGIIVTPEPVESRHFPIDKITNQQRERGINPSVMWDPQIKNGLDWSYFEIGNQLPSEKNFLHTMYLFSDLSSVMALRKVPAGKSITLPGDNVIRDIRSKEDYVKLYKNIKSIKCAELIHATGELQNSGAEKFEAFFDYIGKNIDLCEKETGIKNSIFSLLVQKRLKYLFSQYEVLMVKSLHNLKSKSRKAVNEYVDISSKVRAIEDEFWYAAKMLKFCRLEFLPKDKILSMYLPAKSKKDPSELTFDLVDWGKNFGTTAIDPLVYDGYIPSKLEDTLAKWKIIDSYYYAPASTQNP